MTTLVAINKPFANLTDGYDLRAWHLSRELARFGPLVLVPLSISDRDRGGVNLDPRDIFDDVVEPLVLPCERPSPLRHLRWRDANYYSLGYPHYYRRAVDLIGATLKRHSASRIVAFGADLVGFLRPLRSAKVLMDSGDSTVLYIERYVAARAGMSLAERARWRLAHWRWICNERALPRWFAHVTTCNEADTQAIRRSARGCENVTTVPNGVVPSLERALGVKRAPSKRGVIFWGNLAFHANDQAMRYFFDKVYLPYLAARGVQWCIVGRGAQPWLEKAARHHPSIRLMGFVEDLYSLVADYPVVVNPMVSGGGIKNKVLEALALEKAVVSTPLGMESIAGAISGRHYVEAATPQDMAASVLRLLDDPARCAALGSQARRLILERYTWRSAGEKVRSLLEAM